MSSITNALGKKTYHAYDDLGQVTKTWGDVPQPTWVEYDDYGQRWKLHTYRDDTIAWTGTTWPTTEIGELTTWIHDPATGLLESKTYADSKGTDYTYTVDGKLHGRKWAREVPGQAGIRVTTTYAYSSTTAELTGVTYNDGTPGHTYTYDRRGRTDTVTSSDINGLSFDYDYSNWPASASVTTSGLYAKTITRTFDPAMGGELTGLAVTPVGQGTAEYAAGYGYEATTGRLNSVVGPGLWHYSTVEPVANYTYVAGSDLVAEYAVHPGQGPTTTLKTTRAYEANRDILMSVTHTWHGGSGNPQVISSYDYTRSVPTEPGTAADKLGRRTDLALSGNAFAVDQDWTFGHNDRNELTAADRVFSGQPAADPAWGYTYDPIGNRTQATKTDEPALAYGSNDLNQYFNVHTPSGSGSQQLYYDDDGNLIEMLVSGDMNCDGGVDWRDTDGLVAAMNDNCTNYYAWLLQQTGGDDCYCMNGDLNGDGHINWRDIDFLVGAMNTSGPWMKYTWNAENRLIAVEPGNPQDGDRKVVFAYDYRGRRVRKQVFVYASTPTPGWTPEVIEERRFVWHDWLMLEELSGGTGSGGGFGEPTGAPAENEPVRQYTWGLDIAGLNGGVNSLQTAGGIGGLLAVHQAAIDRDGIDDDVVEGNYLYTHDGNGNVTQVIDNQDYTGGTPVTLGWFSQRLAARYEYDAYGNPLDIDTNGDGTITAADNPGFYVTENPFRFSTKYFDNETGLGYWGYRYYSPKMGRWINRDPIEEMGGIGLYVYAMSSPVVRIDPVGWLSYIDGPCDALSHYLGGVGATVSLGGNLMNDLRQLTFYKFVLLYTIPTAVKGLVPATCGVPPSQKTASGVLTGVLTAPIECAPNGMLCKQDNYSARLNNAIGTINSIAWSVTCTTGSGTPRQRGDRGCCCTAYAKSCSVKFVLRDTYTFNTGFKDFVFQCVFGYAGGGRSYLIQNVWYDRVSSETFEVCR